MTEEAEDHVIHAGDEIFKILIKITHQMDIDISVVEEEVEVSDERQAEIDAGWL